MRASCTSWLGRAAYLGDGDGSIFDEPRETATGADHGKERYPHGDAPVVARGVPER